jgi:hypothetical protein
MGVALALALPAFGSAPALAAAAPAHHVYLVEQIVTGKMIGKPGWPEFSPATITVPADSIVTMTIVNYDDGAAPLPDGSSALAVSGVQDNQALIAQNLARVSDTEHLETSENIAKEYRPDLIPALKAQLLTIQRSMHFSNLPGRLLSHTFTVAALGINVPIPPLSVVTVTFKTGKAGTYTWNCLAPCGTGPGSMFGAMMTPGYMVGTLVVKGS